MKPTKKNCGNCPWLSENCDEAYEGEIKGQPPFCTFIDGDPKYLNKLVQCPKLNCDFGKLRDCFTSPYDEYAKHNGKKFKLLKTFAMLDKYHDGESLPIYLIKLETGEEIEAWPEEIYTDAEIIN